SLRSALPRIALFRGLHRAGRIGRRNGRDPEARSAGGERSEGRIMRWWTFLSLMCFLSGFFALGCQREQGGQAGNEDETYAPRRAPKGEVDLASHRMKGELVRVDTNAKTIVVRLENGMVQTFKIDEDTAVTGVESRPQTKGIKGVHSLLVNEGAEVRVEWKDQ